MEPACQTCVDMCDVLTFDIVFNHNHSSYNVETIILIVQLRRWNVSTSEQFNA